MASAKRTVFRDRASVLAGSTARRWLVDGSIAALVGGWMVFEFATNNSPYASGAAHGKLAICLAAPIVVALLLRRTAPFSALNPAVPPTGRSRRSGHRRGAGCAPNESNQACVSSGEEFTDRIYADRRCPKRSEALAEVRGDD
jgi:hypothetical protein